MFFLVLFWNRKGINLEAIIIISFLERNSTNSVVIVRFKKFVMIICLKPNNRRSIHMLIR